ncbi:hypothetical protein PMO31116_00540 [Pandoraea morbifera]|uniref:Uncharacterized protein n=1 Tax=Pandoraea morbifera TaxID=2508300 RepID=A0A5E4S5B9_9BURK|nr:hypothetical protein [Pandoraea morbifera]VVD69784.1 hypothetical protein PMO31116_00540 [Pandoraea morbifera]
MSTDINLFTIKLEKAEVKDFINAASHVKSSLNDKANRVKYEQITLAAIEGICLKFRKGEISLDELFMHITKLSTPYLYVANQKQ